LRFCGWRLATLALTSGDRAIAVAADQLTRGDLHPHRRQTAGNLLSGVSRGEPKLEGLFDSATNELDADFSPIPPAETRTKAERLARSYARTVPQA
jgi:hypothetical protein